MGDLMPAVRTEGCRYWRARMKGHDGCSPDGAFVIVREKNASIIWKQSGQHIILLHARAGVRFSAQIAGAERAGLRQLRWPKGSMGHTRLGPIPKSHRMEPGCRLGVRGCWACWG